MVAWVALALVLAWWALLMLVVAGAIRAARDPRTLARVMQRMMPKPKPRPATGTPTVPGYVDAPKRATRLG